MEEISTIMKYTNWTKDELLLMREEAPSLWSLWQNFAVLAQGLEIEKEQEKINKLLNG